MTIVHGELAASAATIAAFVFLSCVLLGAL
jgi:hypothetical protein